MEALPKESNYLDLAAMLEKDQRPTLEELQQGRKNQKQIMVRVNISISKNTAIEIEVMRNRKIAETPL